MADERFWGNEKIEAAPGSIVDDFDARIKYILNKRPSDSFSIWHEFDPVRWDEADQYTTWSE